MLLTEITTMSNKHTGTAIASTFAAGVLLLAAVNPRSIIPSLAIKLLGGGAIALSIGVAHKEGVNADAILDSCIKFTQDGWGFLSESVATESKIVVQQLPVPLKKHGELLLERFTQDSSWFDRLQDRSYLKTGQTNAGKTVFTHFEVAWELEHHPDGALRICDINYGKRAEQMPCKPYFGLPRDTSVFTEVDDLISLVDEAFTELERRRKATNSEGDRKWPRYKLIVDEFNRSLARLTATFDEQIRKDFLDKIECILFEGHGYNVLISMNCQSLAVSKIGLVQADQAQLYGVILGDNAVNANEVSKATQASGTESAKDLIAKVEVLRKVPGGKRTGLVKFGGEIQTIIPFNMADMPTVEIPDCLLTDSAAAWVEGLKGAIAEKKAQGLSITKVWDELGDGKQASDNPKYEVFKPIYEAA